MKKFEEYLIIEHCIMNLFHRDDAEQYGLNQAKKDLEKEICANDAEIVLLKESLKEVKNFNNKVAKNELNAYANEFHKIFMEKIGGI